MPGDGHARTQVFVSSYNARRADYHFLCASHAALFGVRSTAAALRPFSKLVGIYYCGLPSQHFEGLLYIVSESSFRSGK